MIYPNILKNKKIGIFGLNKTGISVFKSANHIAERIVCWDDSKTTRDEFSEIFEKKSFNSFKMDFDIRNWSKLDYIIVSPGVPHDHAVFKIKAKIISDIELLYTEHPNKFYIAVTGTNGKSTTCSLIHHVLKKNKFNFGLAGNIGIPVLELEEDIDGCVLELSSFQLELLDRFQADIAIILNISNDHLDRYKNIDEYMGAKLRILKEAKYKIIGLDDKHLSHIYNKIHNDKNVIPISSKIILNEGISVIDNKIIINNEKSLTIPDNLSLMGIHNKQNIAATYACMMCLQNNAGTTSKAK